MYIYIYHYDYFPWCNPASHSTSDASVSVSSCAISSTCPSTASVRKRLGRKKASGDSFSCRLWGCKSARQRQGRCRRMEPMIPCCGYHLVMTNIAMENHHF